METQFKNDEHFGNVTLQGTRKKWVCNSKSGRWSTRHKKAARTAGFTWDGNDMVYIGGKKPNTPWGCRVNLYVPPKPPRKGFGAVIGILTGTHDEFGKPFDDRKG